jgi:hypothetical protein
MGLPFEERGEYKHFFVQFSFYVVYYFLCIFNYFNASKISTHICNMTTYLVFL